MMWAYAKLGLSKGRLNTYPDKAVDHGYAPASRSLAGA